MVLSHDANCWSDMLSEDDKRRTRPLWHYNHIPDDILPALAQGGRHRGADRADARAATRARSSRRAARERRDGGHPGHAARYRYEVVDNWAKLPPGREFNADVAAVGVDGRTGSTPSIAAQHPMVVFDRDGNFLRSWGEGVFRRAHGVHMAPDDTIWLTDDGDHTVRQCTLDGKVLLTIGIPGKPTPYMSGEPFHRCTHTALSPQGDLYVSDGYGNARVHKYSPDGKLLLSWGEPGTDPGQFNIPHNICCDAGRLGLRRRPREPPRPGVRRQRQVRDAVEQHAPALRASTWSAAAQAPLLHRRDRRRRWRSTTTCPTSGRGVSIYSRTGKLLARLGGAARPGSSPGQFISPHGLAVDSRGDIYVGEVSYTNWGNRYKGQPHAARAAQPAEARQGGDMTQPITLQVFSDYV